MPQPILRRIALRAVQLAIVAAGIFVVMLLFSRQAHAATSDTLPTSPLSQVTSAVSSAASPVASAVSSPTATPTVQAAGAAGSAPSTATSANVPIAAAAHAPA